MHYEIEPRVSVVFPVYNDRPEHLTVAIESVLNQSIRTFELLIVDDSTREETCAVVDRFAGMDRRIRVLREAYPPRGLAAALNRGLKVARGEYIARADADDIQAERRLELQVSFLDEHPTVGVVGASMRRVDAEGRPRGVRRYPLDDRAIRRMVCLRPPVCHPVVMVRRLILEMSGGYDENFLKAEDYELWLRLSNSGIAFANLPEILIDYRVSDESKRGRDNWRFNLRAKRHHFRRDRMGWRLLGIVLVTIHICLPRSARKMIYALAANS